MKYFNLFIFTILLSLLSISTSLAFDTSILANMLAREIKKSATNKEVRVDQIKFIAFQPQESCLPEDLKIREIKRPSSVEFTFNCNKRQYRAIANYDILTVIYVAQKPLRRGDTINEDDIIGIKQPVSRIPFGAITNKELIIGKVLKRTLAQGLIIKEEHLYPGIPVKRGSKVNVIINKGQVTIMTEGVLKSDAIVGSNARVRCLQTGKEIVGKLVDKDKVRVSL